MAEYSTKMEGTYNPASLSTLNTDVRDELVKAYSIALGQDKNSWKLEDRHRNLKDSLTKINGYVSNLEGEELQTVYSAIDDIVGITSNNATYQKHKDRLRDGASTARARDYSWNVMQEHDEILNLADIVKGSTETSNYLSADNDVSSQDSNTIYNKPSFWDKSKNAVTRIAAGLVLATGLYGATALNLGCTPKEEQPKFNLSLDNSHNLGPETNESSNYSKREVSKQVTSKIIGYQPRAVSVKNSGVDDTEKIIQLEEQKLIASPVVKTEKKSLRTNFRSTSNNKKVTSKNNSTNDYFTKVLEDLDFAAAIGGGSEGFIGDLQLGLKLNDNYSLLGHASNSRDCKFLSTGLMYGKDSKTAFGLVGLGFDSNGDTAPVGALRYRIDTPTWLALAEARFGGDTDNAEFDNGGAVLGGYSWKHKDNRLNVFAGPSFSNDGAGLAGRVEYLMENKNKTPWGFFARADSANESAMAGLVFGLSPVKTFEQPFGVGFKDVKLSSVSGQEDVVDNNYSNDGGRDDSNGGDDVIIPPVVPPVEPQDGGRDPRDGGDDVSTRRVIQ